MNRIAYAAVLATLGLLGCHQGGQDARPPTTGAAASAPNPVQLSAASGEELVKMLTDSRTRLAGFRELVRRSGKKDETQDINSAEVIVCPQGKDLTPIYVVLSKPTWLSGGLSHSGFAVENPEELFGSLDTPEEKIRMGGKLNRLSDLVIYAFDVRGKAITPFGGNNMLDDGLIADINGDGFVERADYTNYGCKGVENVQVMAVSTVQAKTRTLLAVLYNWGPTEDWDYQFTDRDNDGIAEIEFGPAGGAGIVKPVAVFRWDKNRKSYVGPEAKEGDHFHVLACGPAGQDDFWNQLDNLKARLKPFAPDPLATGSAQSGSAIEHNEPLRGSKPAPPPAKPYKYASLKNLSNEQLCAYMADGRKQYQFEHEQIIQTHVPKDFWTMPPRQAALATVDVNRTPEHRAAYLLAVDDRDRKKPPEACSVYYSHRSRRCYFTSDSKFFLRLDPKGSYLAYTNQAGRGAVYASIIDTQPIYDLRRVELTYDEARQFAQTIWWLARVRSWTRKHEGLGSMMSSSADGSGSLRLTAPGMSVAAEGTIWADAVSERWSGNYSEEVLLNLADYLFQETMTQHLDKRWTEQDPGSGGNEMIERAMGGNPTTQGIDGQLAKEQIERTHRSVKRMLELFSDDESRLAFPILTEAVQAAGDMAMTDLAPRLKEIQSHLKPPAKLVQTTEDIEKQVFEDKDPKKGLFDKDPKEGLYEKWKKAQHGVLPETAREELRRTVEMALKQVGAAADVDKLQAWAQTWDEGWQWATSRLRRLDKAKYVAALEWHLKDTKGKWTRQIFDAILQADPERAKALADKLPAGKKDDLTVSAYSVLEKAQAIKDQDKRIDALIAVALDPKSGWEQRGQAIEFLVPEKTPLKFPDRKIDKALLKLFDPSLADDTINFTLASACQALALRGRLEYFDRMAKLLASLDDSEIRGRVLGSLVRLAQAGGPQHRAKMLALLAPHLKQTNQNLSDIVSHVYAMDLRELKGPLEAIATAGPDDYEGEKAYSSSSGDPTPVDERYHMPRKVLAVWNEEDAATKAKLLIAMGILNTADEGDAALQSTLKQLQELSKTLSPQQRKAAVDFMDWYEKTPPTFDRTESPEAKDFAKLARSILT